MRFKRTIRSMWRRGWVLAALIAVRFLSLVSPAQQPNIVLINIDDMGWGDFHVYGSASSPTQNIDALAAEGSRFAQFYTAAPICSPSRAGLLTGQYSARSGINSFLEGTVSNL